MKIISFIVMAMSATMAIYYFAPSETALIHHCHLSQGPCTLKGADSSLTATLSLSPLPIKSNEVLHYLLKVKGVKLDQVSIHLVGKSMHMEEDYFHLDKVGQGQWRLKRPFPLCTEKKMLWKLGLIMKKKNAYWRSFFDLEVASVVGVK